MEDEERSASGEEGGANIARTPPSLIGKGVGNAPPTFQRVVLNGPDYQTYTGIPIGEDTIPKKGQGEYEVKGQRVDWKRGKFGDPESQKWK